ncbi:hypothetical protein [Nocardioides acrostichi]|uniref:Uncharacterized protein n=1 Tax=Nocardioides acrostichi TaxID=2784339 RepID=A0A930Y4H1_9ACTN|nr:hypothetical protein [Nocardioides acrostichi]MBF4160175.1 hypothetical protein [Nocardioides acrostichi]
MTARERILAILRTDPADTDCSHALELIDLYVDLVLAGEDPEAHLPGAHVHLRECGACRRDFEGLLVAVRDIGAGCSP